VVAAVNVRVVLSNIEMAKNHQKVLSYFLCEVSLGRKSSIHCQLERLSITLSRPNPSFLAYTMAFVATCMFAACMFGRGLERKTTTLL
jgi:hypothetical protein